MCHACVTFLFVFFMAIHVLILLQSFTCVRRTYRVSTTFCLICVICGLCNLLLHFHVLRLNPCMPLHVTEAFLFFCIPDARHSFSKLFLAIVPEYLAV